MGTGQEACCCLQHAWLARPPFETSPPAAGAQPEEDRPASARSAHAPPEAAQQPAASAAQPGGLPPACSPGGCGDQHTCGCCCSWAGTGRHCHVRTLSLMHATHQSRAPGPALAALPPPPTPAPRQRRAPPGSRLPCPRPAGGPAAERECVIECRPQCGGRGARGTSHCWLVRCGRMPQVSTAVQFVGSPTHLQVTDGALLLPQLLSRRRRLRLLARQSVKRQPAGRGAGCSLEQAAGPPAQRCAPPQRGAFAGGRMVECPRPT